jgi:hypothetical protein
MPDIIGSTKLSQKEDAYTRYRDNSANYRPVGNLFVE